MKLVKAVLLCLPVALLLVAVALLRVPPDERTSEAAADTTSPVARAPEPAAPVRHTWQQPPVVAEPVSPEPDPAPGPSVPDRLPAADEIARISGEVARSGPATGAAWEHEGYQLLSRHFTSSVGGTSHVRVHDYTCHSEGCIADVRFPAIDGAVVHDALVRGSVVQGWPGPRITSPIDNLTSAEARVVVVLLQPDA